MVRYDFGIISFELIAGFDFLFLKDYGEVFKVFDMQDSGNLCFGVQTGSQKLFLKMAGAETVRSNTLPQKAIERLKGTSIIYDDLRHPYLLNIVEHRAIPGGYLQVYEWFDGVCMGKQYGQRERILALPVEEKLDIYRCILDFHSHVNDRGYVAIDFYDGSIMYDFEKKQTRICDIEFYSRMPYVNAMGRMWGSGRFMSPEEFELGAVIDERTNVFNMGATAFQLFGGGTARSRSEWQLDQRRYEAALQAVSMNREERFASIAEYAKEWDPA